jgi:uncharacterized membrane protein
MNENQVQQTRSEKFKAFLARKEINPSAKTYFVTAMGAMAAALFATLLMSTILGTLGDLIFGKGAQDFLHTIKGYASGATGMAIGAAIAYSLKAQPLVIFSATVVGSMANTMGATIDGAKFAAGPAGIFFVAIIAVEIGKMVSKETKVDILVTPLTVLLVGFGAAKLICPVMAYVMYWTAEFIGIATAFAPLLMGAVVAVVVGVVLTLPISSAALCASIFAPAVVNASQNKEALLLAAGAAAVGCCCQMVGFAAASFRENGVGGLVAQGLGTSMLQMPNIYRNPRIWLAPTIASAICGAMSTTLFDLQCVGVSAGMGTCGMVGPIGLFTTAYDLGTKTGAKFWIGVSLLCIVLPAALSIGFDLLFRRLGWVKDGDMKLDL